MLNEVQRSSDMLVELKAIHPKRGLLGRLWIILDQRQNLNL